MQTFEDRLLAELKDVVAARMDKAPQPVRGRRGRRRLVMAGAGIVVAAGVTTAVPVLLGQGGSQANAVEQGPNGSLRIYARDYRHPEVIEQELRGYQVKSTVTFLPEGRQCKEPRAHYVPDSPWSSTLLTWDESNSGDSPPPPLLDVTSVTPSETVVLTLQYVKKGGPFVGMASLATGPVLPCKMISGGIQRFGHRQPVAPPQP
ncbi:MAG: hypothetical protein JWN52_6487 [Actinomycetia bacterium]|nr:hypothetical protein [Actinomycetes bacterium]